MSRHIMGICVVLMVVMVASGVTAEQPAKGMNYFIDGLEFYESGDYETALDAFSDAIEEDSSNLQYQYYYALCYKQLGQIPEAISILTAILSSDAKQYYTAYFDLASIYSDNKDYQKALQTLNDAEWAVPDSGRIYMEKGYVCMKMKQHGKAVENFKQAIVLDPKQTQLALYNIGNVWLEIGDTEKARAMFEKAVAEDPSSDIADYARQGIRNSDLVRRASKPWHLFAMFGYAYDDNIPNDPLDRPGISPDPATDLGDQYQTLTVNGFYKIVSNERFGLDAGYLMTYLHYNDSDNENSFGNSPYVVAKYTRGPWYVDLKYSFAWYLADSDSKQVQHSLMPTVSLTEAYGMQSLLTLLWQDRDYKDDGLTPDATQWMASFVQLFTIPETSVKPAIGLKTGDEDADTDASSYSFFEYMTGVSFDLPWKTSCNLSFTGIRSDYDSSDDREDDGYIISTLLSRPFTDIVTGRFSYTYVKNDSNISSPGYDPYEYEKNIVMVLAEVNL